MCGWSISNGQLIVEWANEHDQSALAKFIKICKCRATNESNKKCSACTCGRLLVLNNVKYVAGYAKPNKCVTILPTGVSADYFDSTILLFKLTGLNLKLFLLRNA